jgi:hypothetical protein
MLQTYFSVANKGKLESCHPQTKLYEAFDTVSWDCLYLHGSMGKLRDWR